MPRGVGGSEGAGASGRLLRRFQVAFLRLVMMLCVSVNHLSRPADVALGWCWFTSGLQVVSESPAVLLRVCALLCRARRRCGFASCCWVCFGAWHELSEVSYSCKSKGTG